MRRIQAGIKRYWGEWAEPFLVRFNSGDGRVHSLDEPLPVQDCSNRYGLVQPFILHQDAPGRPRLLDEPVPTIRGRNGHGLVEPFIVHYYGNGDAVPTRIPLATVTTKDRFALVEGKAGLDITLRMLHPRELAAAQGFPSGYDFAGTKTDQVKQIGNAVPVGLARALALEALSA
jgi:DNA (cytosine-5)-methyltransferase 1